MFSHAKSLEIPHRVDEHLQAVAHRAGLAAGPAGMMRGIEMPLGVRHQAQYPAGSVADAGHVGHRAVGVVGKGQMGGGDGSCR